MGFSYETYQSLENLNNYKRNTKSYTRYNHKLVVHGVSYTQDDNNPSHKLFKVSTGQPLPPYI